MGPQKHPASLEWVKKGRCNLLREAGPGDGRPLRQVRRGQFGRVGGGLGRGVAGGRGRGLKAGEGLDVRWRHDGVVELHDRRPSLHLHPRLPEAREPREEALDRLEAELVLSLSTGAADKAKAWRGGKAR